MDPNNAFTARKRVNNMSAVKEKMIKVIQKQPEDASFEEIIRELAFEDRIERGLDDSQEGRTISNAEMKRRIRAWQSES